MEISSNVFFVSSRAAGLVEKNDCVEKIFTYDIVADPGMYLSKISFSKNDKLIRINNQRVYKIEKINRLLQNITQE